MPANTGCPRSLAFGDRGTTTVRSVAMTMAIGADRPTLIAPPQTQAPEARQHTSPGQSPGSNPKITPHEGPQWPRAPSAKARQPGTPVSIASGDHPTHFPESCPRTQGAPGPWHSETGEPPLSETSQWQWPLARIGPHLSHRHHPKRRRRARTLAQGKALGTIQK